MSQIYKNCCQILLLAVLCFGTTTVQASQVPLKEAKKVALTAFASKSAAIERSAKDLSITEEYTQMIGDKPVYYIFNIEPKGFIIVSAEDGYNTVLAFSDESQLQLDNAERMSFIHGNLYLHEQRIEQIQSIDYKPIPEVALEWDRFRNSRVEDFAGKTPEGMVIPPLTTTTWNQGKYYNAYTPADNIDPEAPDGRTFCGCAPIAMAQLIKYHDYPAVGNGAIKYDDPDYGEQAVDFCRPYNWSAMPDSLSDYNDDVSEFIYHVGASTQTFYSTVYTETYISYMRDAMVNFWNYDAAASWFLDTDNEFADVAIRDLNRGRPVLLSGQAWNGGIFGGAHTWVADGYGYSPSTGDPYFHFNWGWGGDNNGWFLDATGSWAPIPFSSGIRPITYYWERYVIHNIFPAEQNCGAPNYIYVNSVTPVRASFATDYVTEYEKTVNFRYRKLGAADWVVLPTTTTYYAGSQVLEPETEYEVQVRKQCCEGSWSAYSQSEYFETPEQILANPCEVLRFSNLTTSSITENNAYIYTSQPYGKDVDNQFRYRFVGSALWSYTNISSSYYRYLNNLQPATNYEFQVRHTCDQGEWTEYGDSKTFKTEGQVTTCAVQYPVDLFTSSTSETNTYIYTTQPYGQVDNEFRYKAVQSSNWITTTTSKLYYRYLSGLTLGTEYEFQVRHLCDGVNYTDWSSSANFTTLGGVIACEPINGERLYTSSISKSNAYIYTPQPYGQVANQFRYRISGSTTWVNSSVSTLYYRYLSNLQASTTYEFQTSHECAVSSWSPWSSSKTFTTSAGFGGGGVGKILPPYEDPSFDPAYLAELEAKIYPNPVTDMIAFESNLKFTEESMLRLLDLSGKVVSEVFLQEGERVGTVDVDHLSSGLYVLQYSDGYNTLVERVIKN